MFCPRGNRQPDIINNADFDIFIKSFKKKYMRVKLRNPGIIVLSRQPVWWFYDIIKCKVIPARYISNLLSLSQ